MRIIIPLAIELNIPDSVPTQFLVENPAIAATYFSTMDELIVSLKSLLKSAK